MNVRKLRKLKRYILAEPRRYYQHYWLVTDKIDKLGVVAEQKPPCGTVACLAGNACLMEGFKPHPRMSGAVRTAHGRLPLNVAIEAQRILGLSDLQRGALFNYNCYGWSERAREAYHNSITVLGRARAAAMAIDDLIASEADKRPVRKSNLKGE